MKLPNLFHRQNLKKGILFVLLGWLSLSTMYAVSKLLGTQTNVPTMLFFRNVFGAVVILPWIFKYWPKSIKVKNIKLVLARSTLGLVNLCFIFLAIKKISLVNTTLLNNTAPFFVPFIVWFWFKKPFGIKLLPAIVIGFIGIALILEPDKRIFNLGAIYGLLSGITLAFSLLTIRLSRHETLHTLLLYIFVIGIILTAPFAIFGWKVENGLTLLGLLSIGLFSFLGQIFLYYGLREAKARQLAPFTYATVIFSGIYEWLIWGISIKPIAYLGMIFIIAAGIWIVFASRTPKDIERENF